MKKSRFSEEQIAYALRMSDGGTPVVDVCRQIGISEATFCTWKKKYGELGVSELRKLRQRSLWRQERCKVSVHRSCRLALLQRSSWYAKSAARDQSLLRQRIRDLAMSRPRFGYRRVLVMLKREGWEVGEKRVYRLYRLEGLQLRMKVKRRKRIALPRGKPQPATGPNQHWSMDFVHDQTQDGRLQPPPSTRLTRQPDLERVRQQQVSSTPGSGQTLVVNCPV
ncbi:transposase [Hydrogenophaga sp. ANAO-22]|jgi:transposase|uniref:transposase n=1 Tax=Hydrogenophaga sp. ANAO-22 TaxID=3166645 RepID=UPI0036D209E7